MKLPVNRFPSGCPSNGFALVIVFLMFLLPNIEEPQIRTLIDTSTARLSAGVR
ncbi:MAG: hypothetical protein K9N23_23100 [Akkermansiaceae bacterium]|nr:hypothetical protein [Akkermansiaceae bacterium]